MSRKFYIHDRSRGYVGNSMVWWKRGHHGYTCDLREAHVFDESELPKYLNNTDDLEAYPVEAIDPVVSHHVDQQAVPPGIGVRRVPEDEGEQRA